MCQEKVFFYQKIRTRKKEFFCRIQKIRSFYAFRTNSTELVDRLKMHFKRKWIVLKKN
ncbi:hypothetical protein LEP1GSC133_0432 [Leptospira borgpetersenii serovar Pomona str. 200901868]|uniref:Uncharacterized protein n=1 Tax=Leptospira borgpetersenii serovar Pomona str. 200901868 TaxID=1192866 RepID=M6WIW2_LEPBO|nr:hypothetical protein LEP1GSC133_0432 [Leptospira borgpetersenii serovar Pomona str. 200901868]